MVVWFWYKVTKNIDFHDYFPEFYSNYQTQDFTGGSIPLVLQKDSKTDFKRSPFTMQKESFYNAKGVLLERKRSPFWMQKDSFRNAAVEKRRFCTCFYYLQRISDYHLRAISASVLPCSSAWSLSCLRWASNSGVSMLCLRKCSRAMRLSCSLLLHFSSHNEVANQAAVGCKRSNLR